MLITSDSDFHCDADASVIQVNGENATGRTDVGDRVVLIRSPRDLPLDERYQLSDVQRGRSLAGLALLFAVVVVASGGCVGCSRLLVSG